MEAFSLLKYWRSGGGGGDSGGVGRVFVDGGVNVRTKVIGGATTLVTALSAAQASDTDDDGPFFDLEFAVPDEDEKVENKDSDDDEGECSGDDDGFKVGDESDSEEISDGENERELKFSLSSVEHVDQDVSFSPSPSDDLFYKGSLATIDSSSLVLHGSGANSKSQFHASLLRSATKFRFLMLKLKKSRSNVSEKTEPNGTSSAISKPEQNEKAENQEEKQHQKQGKIFTVKFKVEEVPIVSFFSRDNSSKDDNNRAPKQKPEEVVSDDKQFSKDMMQKYLNKVKPLYVRVSKRYAEKLRFSGQLSSSGGATTSGATSPPAVAEKKQSLEKLATGKNESEQAEASDALPLGNMKSQKQGNLQAGLRVVCKHLGKSRSTVSVAPSSRRRDDSLLQQQDGIQSAILHCKRSFNASRDLDSSVVSRPSSDP